MFKWLFCGVVLMLGFSNDTLATTLTSYRGQAGLSIPQWDETLAELCATRAQDLSSEGKIQHDDAQGRGPGLQSVDQGYPVGEFGEVLGAGPSWIAVWNAWLQSPVHLKIIRAAHWARWGFAKVTTANTTIWVVRFWKP